MAELAHHGVTPSHGIRFSLDLSKAKVLDLTDEAMAKAWGYSGGPISSSTQAIGARAQSLGYNVVKYQSLRVPGANYVVLGDWERLLQPQMVTPTTP
jgi:hypothetical protein